MGKNLRRQCKGCKAYFELSQSEVNFFSRRVSGLAPFRFPKYCETCRKERKLRGIQLARRNFPVPGSRGGDGCYEELTSSDLDDIRFWRSGADLELKEQSKFLHETNRPRKKDPLVYTIYAPVLPNYALHNSNNDIVFSWRSVAPSHHTTAPDSIKFSIEGKLAGAAWLRNTPEGLLLWWLEYAPWIKKYKKAILSLPFYAIAESIKRGNGGRLLFKPSSQFKELFNSLGCRPIFNGSLLELQAEDAWHLVLKEHGVAPAVINKLLDAHSHNSADILWIVMHISKGNLTPRFIEAFTYLANDLNWLDIKRLADERGNLPDSEELKMRYKVRDIFSAIAVNRLFKKLGAQVRYDSSATPVPGLLITFSEQKTIRNFQIFDPELDAVTQQTMAIPAGTETLIIARVLLPNDYNSKNENFYGLLKQLTEQPRVGKGLILAVSQDFKKLDQQKQKEVVLSLNKQNIRLLVLRKQAKAFLSYVRDMLRYLDLRTSQQSKEDRN